MKNYFLAVFIFFSINLFATGPNGFGLGVIGGEPSGLSAKYHLNQVNALDFAAAWSFQHDVIHLHSDYLFHDFDIVPVRKGNFGIYFGIGGRVTIHDDDNDNDKNDNDDVYFGIRVPVGIDYYFANFPIEIFLEIVPALNLFPGTDFDLDGGIGIRYYF